MTRNAQPPGGGIPRAVRESPAGGRMSRLERNPPPADVEVARLRAHLRRVGELVRIARVGE